MGFDLRLSSSSALINTDLLLSCYYDTCEEREPNGRNGYIWQALAGTGLHQR